MFIVSSITEYNTARTITYNKALANIQQVLSSTMHYESIKQHYEIPDPASRRQEDKLKCIIFDTTDVPPDQSSFILLPPQNEWPSMFISDNKILFRVMRDKGGEKLP